ncbi:JmjC domain-containing histone demethylation protein 3D, partial [Ophiobolus disseminans]
MVPTLEKFSSREDVLRTGLCHLHVRDFSLQSVEFDPSSVQDANRTTTELKYNTTSSVQPGVMRIISDKSARSTTPYPDFSDIYRQQYSDSNLEVMFESFCKRGSTKRATPQWYLIGSSEEVFGERCRYSDLLTPGPYMQQSLNTVIAGVNSSYIYASYSVGQTATAMHYEDCQWFSVNLMLCGAPKLWLSVEPASNKTLEAGLKLLFPGVMASCSQRVRHLSFLLAPSVLQKLGVRYHIKACYPGELVFTTPAAYHQIINLGPNMAEAINFMDSKIPAYPHDYTFCTSDICGVDDSVGAHHFRSNKRPWQEETASEIPPGKKNRNDVAILDIVLLQQYSLGYGEHLFHRLVRKSSTSILVSVLTDFEYRSEWLHGTITVFSQDDDFDINEKLLLLKPQYYLAQNQTPEKPSDAT